MEKNVKMKDIKELGEQLGELQRVCREKKIPVMIAFEGYGAAGKGLQIGNLIQALDPRGFKVYAVNLRYLPFRQKMKKSICIRFCGVSGRRSQRREGLRFLIPAGTGEL